MSRYPGEVTVPRVVAGLVLAALGVATLAHLAHLLVPRREILPSLPAPAAEDPAAPGAIVCPSVSELPPAGEAAEVEAGSLIDCPGVFDGRRIAYTGEVIDAVLFRGDRAWLHVNDDLYSGEAGPLPENRTALGGELRHRGVDPPASRTADSLPRQQPRAR